MNIIKYLLTFTFFISIIEAFAQSSPVAWSASALKKGKKSWVLNIDVNPLKGWRAYSREDTSIQVAPFEISWENQNVVKTGVLQKSGMDTVIHDRIFNNRPVHIFNGSFRFLQEIEINGAIPPVLKVTIHGFAANGKEFEPVEESKLILLEDGVDSPEKLTPRIKISAIDLNNPRANCGMGEKKETSLPGFFLLGMIGGFIALLTPCVFPMIPITVSFFINRSKTKREGIKNGFFYGFSILLIYLLASVPFHLIGNIRPEILNSISTNAWVNLAFFFIFIFFALSFFGLFELSLPASIINKTDSKSSAGSLAGIFFMALTLTTVSFSCTGPILGSLLAGSFSASGGSWQLTAGMGGFGLALSLPFAMFAMFPGWLKKIPKSGGWLDTVKKILAFLELALAFKFLSNADLVQHWGILKREIFIGIWIAIFLCLAIYLFYRSLVIPGFLAFCFTAYLFPGLTSQKNANLKLLSGLAPPLSYSLYKKESGDSERVKPVFINNYDEALKLSRSEHKPLLIDFTGWACVNCRKMEEQVWTNPEVAGLIKNRFILVSLYVDDRKKLQESFTYKGKDIETAGDKWATFQAENFSQATQPLYVILNPDQQLMNTPVGYTPDPRDYQKWLECGLGAELDERHKPN